MARFIGRSAAGLLLLGLGCCKNGEVLRFTATPNVICPGEPVVLAWVVEGDAELKAQPPPTDWRDDKRSQGELTVRPAVPTTFTVRALDANPAENRAYGEQPIRIRDAHTPEKRGTSAPCDAATRVCTKSVVMDAGSGLRIASLSNPELVRQGQAQAREVCVTPPSGQKTCVAPGATSAVDSLADGTWVFEAKLAEGEAELPQPKLQVQVDFACQAPSAGGRS